MVVAFVGMVVFVIGETDCIENQMIVNTFLVNTGGKYKRNCQTQGSKRNAAQIKKVICLLCMLPVLSRNQFFSPGAAKPCGSHLAGVDNTSPDRAKAQPLDCSWFEQNPIQIPRRIVKRRAPLFAKERPSCGQTENLTVVFMWSILRPLF